ncbi:unnamed protein product [Nippostrongylus brasiliensis]|uniref:Transposase n=1 Tax=Nippostrongylus brasiliensis TaxID=27835 RepID=A0A0N4XUZ5_NIPBR|nr:hypothetical protein Q1695_011820 [Nippostrongylus brasiliensis]VDL70161.1 unnamed protein product [Nippostrongylus brasiliensis]
MPAKLLDAKLKGRKANASTKYISRNSYAQKHKVILAQLRIETGTERNRRNDIWTGGENVAQPIGDSDCNRQPLVSRGAS